MAVRSRPPAPRPGPRASGARLDKGPLTSVSGLGFLLREMGGGDVGVKLLGPRPAGPPRMLRRPEGYCEGGEEWTQSLPGRGGPACPLGETPASAQGRGQQGPAE